MLSDIELCRDAMLEAITGGPVDTVVEREFRRGDPRRTELYAPYGAFMPAV